MMYMESYYLSVMDELDIPHLDSGSKWNIANSQNMIIKCYAVINHCISTK